MGSGREGIQIEQQGIGQVLSNNKLTIPPNQREYSWGETQVTSLFQDIAKAISTSEQNYFLGTIVGIPADNDSLQIIDGQQRLATTSIFLASARNYLTDKDEMMAKGIEDLLFTIDRKKREYVPSLQLGKIDNDYFRALITDGVDPVAATRPSHYLLNEAMVLSKTQVNDIVKLYELHEHGDILNQWVEFIEKNVLVLLLTVSSKANAYKMFETLNDRGLKTTQSDLVKNYLFGRARDRFDEVELKWNYMRGTLEALDNNDITIDFLRYALTATNGYTREDEVYELTEKIANSEQGTLDYARNMERLALSYIAIHMPQHEKWNEFLPPIRKSISVINMFNIKPMKPLLMAIADRFNKKEAGLAYDFLLSLSVRMAVASSTRSGTIFTVFGNAAKAVYTKDVVKCAALKMVLNAITPSDAAFKEAFAQYRSNKASISRYLLRSLERKAKGETNPWYIPNDDPEDITLEHVLPQKPEGNWPQFTDDEHSLSVRRLGNLTLLQNKSNSDLKSMSFLEKSPVLGGSPYKLTKMIADYDDWDSKSIKHRQKQLADLALKVWQV